MKIFRNTSTAAIIFSIVVLLILFLNYVLGIYPVLDLIKYLESKKNYWLVPSATLLIFGIWLFDRSMRKKLLMKG
jgi:ABC-type dipeptide/oligopeptide/nickel transport system permease component